MGYTITFSDVMALVMTAGIGLLGWFLKSYLTGTQKTNEEQSKKLGEIDAKYGRRIGAAEEKMRCEVQRLDKDIAEMKSDFATVFVLREDYFRAMDKMDGNFKDIERKIDRLLLVNNITTVEVKESGRVGTERSAPQSGE